MSLAHALLAALSHAPATGYDLSHHFERSLGHFWPASHQQIYRELARLEAEGWVEFEAQAGAGRPGRKIYRLTSPGCSELQRWLALPGEPPPIRDALLVRLYGGAEPEVLLTELRRQQDFHRQRLEFYQQIETAYFPEPARLDYKRRLIWLTLQAGLMYQRQRLAWFELALNEIGGCASGRAEPLIH